MSKWTSEHFKQQAATLLHIGPRDHFTVGFTIAVIFFILQVMSWIQNLYEQGKVVQPKETVKVLLDYLSTHEIEPCGEISGAELMKIAAK